MIRFLRAALLVLPLILTPAVTIAAAEACCCQDHVCCDCCDKGCDDCCCKK